MQNLLDAGLYGAGLVDVETPQIVERYNACLEAMGCSATSLAAFRVDGRGWSPEIARERSDPDYLSHDPAAQMAVVVSPDQRDKPIWWPARSFDRHLMGTWFERSAGAVADVTTTHGLWLDFDLGLTHYRSPADLLEVREVVVRARAQGLQQAALEQRALVETFVAETDAWFDERLRRRILASASAHGDLRSRRVRLPELRFRTPRAFHTRAFGGTFVFRSDRFAPGVLALEDASLLGAIEDARAEAYALDDPSLLDRLHEMGLVEIDISLYRRRPEALEEIWDWLTTELLAEADPEVEPEQLSTASRKQRLLTLRDRAPAVLFELERLIWSIRQQPGKRPPLPSAELQRYLLHPAEAMREPDRTAVWMLLGRILPMDPARRYACDKVGFYADYGAWPEPKKRLAVERIRRCATRTERQGGGPCSPFPTT